MAGLKPSEELVAATFAASLVYGIFSSNLPTLVAVQQEQPGSDVIHSTLRSATVTAAAAVSGIALLAKSPTVFVVGGALILVETWKYKAANHTAPKSS
jgi:Flp pilus assembly protein TadB